MACGLPMDTQVNNQSLPSTFSRCCTTASPCLAGGGRKTAERVEGRERSWLVAQVAERSKDACDGRKLLQQGVVQTTAEHPLPSSAVPSVLSMPGHAHLRGLQRGGHICRLQDGLAHVHAHLGSSQWKAAVIACSL